MDSTFSRRHLLRLAGVGTGALALAACSGDPDADRTVSANATGAILDCVRTVEQDAPFDLDVAPERVELANGRPGSLLEINFTVQDSDNCLPVPNAEVTLWHADAQGRYSGVANQETSGETFLRGTQTTNASGTVSFTTIYPGWVPGRTAHLNVKVTFAGETRLVTQLFFPDDITNSIYTTHEAYVERGGKDTTNDTDPGGARLARLRMEVIEANTGHFASHAIGIDT